MKQLTAIFLFILSICEGQSIDGFLGVPFGCSKDSAWQILNSRFPGRLEIVDDNILITDTKFGGRDADLTFGFTSHGFHSGMAVVKPVYGYDMFELYDQCVEDVAEKYGVKSFERNEWKYPFDESDRKSHGMTALKTGKVALRTYWTRLVLNPDGTTSTNKVVVQLRRPESVGIIYISDYYYDFKERERKDKNLKDY